MIKSTRKYVLYGKTPILGSNPANPKIHEEFVANKAANLTKAKEETAMLPTPEEYEEMVKNIKAQGFTVFLRDEGKLVMAGYTIKGFFKSAMSTLKSQLNIGSPRGKIDELLFIGENYIPILRRNGDPVTAPDEIFERPLRAETMQGPRVSLAASEQVNDWMLVVTLTLLENAGTAKSKPLTWDAIEDCLSYGEFKGLGQWRNSGLGSFTYEQVA